MRPTTLTLPIPKSVKTIRAAHYLHIRPITLDHLRALRAEIDQFITAWEGADSA